MAEDEKRDEDMTAFDRFERASEYSKKAVVFADKGKDNAALAYLCRAFVDVAEGLLIKEMES